MARPSKLPVWNINEANATEPPSSRQTDGWAITAGVPEKPPVEWHNYIWNLQYKWIDYLDTDKADNSYVDSQNQAQDTIINAKADKTNVLELDNTTQFTPDSDYEPATKKYVDDKGTKISADGKSITKNDNSNIKNQCTAWVNFAGSTTPVTIRDSFNVSDVVRVGTGVFDIYFEEDMDNLGYSVTTGAKQIDDNAPNLSTANPRSPEVDKIRIVTSNENQHLTNHSQISIQVFGGKN